jgi:hypothetical protein
MQSEVKSILVKKVVFPEITDVYFDSYSNPSLLNIKIKNSNTFSISVTIGVWVDTYGTSVPPRAEHTEEIAASTETVIPIPVSSLSLSAGSHFAFCSIRSFSKA